MQSARTSACTAASAGVARRSRRIQNWSEGRGSTPVLVVTTRRRGRSRMRTTGGIVTSTAPPTDAAPAGVVARLTADVVAARGLPDVAARWITQRFLGAFAAGACAGLAPAGVLPCPRAAAPDPVTMTRATRVASSRRVRMSRLSAPRRTPLTRARSSGDPVDGRPGGVGGVPYESARTVFPRTISS